MREANKMDLMMDLIYIGVMVGFFALSAGLIGFCAKLMGKGDRP
jgi:hypothetical protein